MEERIKMMLPLLNEKQRRLYLASEAITYGHGGIAEAIRHSGVSRNTIKRGIRELETGITNDGRVRQNGGGRDYVERKYPYIEEKIRQEIDGSTYGDPERVLSYTTESLRKIERELKSQGINVSHETIGKILCAMGYSKKLRRRAAEHCPVAQD